LGGDNGHSRHNKIQAGGARDRRTGGALICRFCP